MKPMTGVTYDCAQADQCFSKQQLVWNQHGKYVSAHAHLCPCRPVQKTELGTGLPLPLASRWLLASWADATSASRNRTSLTLPVGVLQAQYQFHAVLGKLAPGFFPAKPSSLPLACHSINERPTSHL
jgi:hypothetical protein